MKNILILFFVFIVMFSPSYAEEEKIVIDNPAEIAYFEEVKKNISATYNPPKSKLFEIRQSFVDVEFSILNNGSVDEINVFNSRCNEEFLNYIKVYLSTTKFPTFPENLNKDKVTFKVRLASQQKSFYLPIPIPVGI